MVLDFLSRLFSEENIQATTKAKALIAQASFQTVFARSRYEAKVELVFREEDEVRCWPETIQ